MDVGGRTDVSARRITSFYIKNPLSEQVRQRRIQPESALRIRKFQKRHPA